MKAAPKVLLIDLGNVLIDLSIEEFREMARVRSGKLIEIGNDPMHHRYMAGEWDEDEMRRRLEEMYDMTIPAEEFPRFWSVMLGPDRLALLPMLEQVRAKGIKTALCSNTDQTHIAFLEQQGSPMIKGFDFYCYSYELNAVKPDPEYFKKVLKRVGHSPEDCLFIDDSEENVLVARKLGIPSKHVADINAVRRALRAVIMDH